MDWLFVCLSRKHSNCTSDALITKLQHDDATKLDNPYLHASLCYFSFYTSFEALKSYSEMGGIRIPTLKVIRLDWCNKVFFFFQNVILNTLTDVHSRRAFSLLPWEIYRGHVDLGSTFESMKEWPSSHPFYSWQENLELCWNILSTG